MKRMIIMLLLIILCGIVFTGCISLSKIKRESKERFQIYENKSQFIKTRYGKLSFIDEGAGEPILSCHGICGGYDQAYDTVKEFGNDLRIIAPSRFGYPGSNLPEDATIEMQVEAFIDLLDYLNIEKTYVLATSAGSTTAIQFALQHPERTKGLILYCSGFPASEPAKKPLKYEGPPAPFCNDFAMWLISPFFKPLMGMDKSTLKVILPMKQRKSGIIFDAKVTNTVMVNNYTQYDLGVLEVPVLIIHSKDDKLANFKTVEPWIPKIKNCTFVPLEEGGHLMTGNSEIINKAVMRFIEQ